MTDPETRHVLVELKILVSLKDRSTPIAEWVLHTMNVETFDYSTEAWVEEDISNGMKRHQNAKCFNCGKLGQLKRDCR